MSAPEQATEPDGYDMVLRLRVTAEGPSDLAEAVSQILRREPVEELFGKEAAFTLRVLQPVIGPAPAVWELRINVPTLERLGRMLDWANGQPRSSNGNPGRSILNRLQSITGVDVIDDGVPLYRAWQIT